MNLEQHPFAASRLLNAGTGISAIVIVLVLMFAFGSVFVVDEGHVGIVKRFGEAIEQTDPGIHTKMPMIDKVEELEIRTRKNVERMSTSSKEQMPVTAEVSVNWTVNKEYALELYKKYGGLQQFEDRILDPRFRSATKDALPRFTAEELIQNRSAAIARVEEILSGEMKDFPIKVDNVQIEDLEFPPAYIKSIETKQTAKNLADAEAFNLKRQNLTAQQAVNTANADRDADKARADGRAYAAEVEARAAAEAIRIKGLAEAEAMRAKATAVASNPLLVEYTKAQQWDGALPKTVLGDGQNLLLNMK